jgi:hypothetical protein
MWNKERYDQVKTKCSCDLKSGFKQPHDYMHEYKKMVEKEDYEACKAITEILEPLNFFTADTHQHIKSLR